MLTILKTSWDGYTSLPPSFNDTHDRKDFDITSLTQEYNKVLIF